MLCPECHSAGCEDGECLEIEEEMAELKRKLHNTIEEMAELKQELHNTIDELSLSQLKAVAEILGLS